MLLDKRENLHNAATLQPKSKASAAAVLQSLLECKPPVYFQFLGSIERPELVFAALAPAGLVLVGMRFKFLGEHLLGSIILKLVMRVLNG